MSLPPSDFAGDAGTLLTRMQQRCQTSPRHLIEPGPDAAQVHQLFAAAASAPDHGQILPWRLVCVEAPARRRLADLFELALLEREPAAGAQQIQRARDKATHAPFLALAVLREGGDAHGSIPATERAVSLGCALQNMLLMAHAQGFGAGLVSGQAMHSPALRQGFELSAGERAVCFIAVGTPARTRSSRQRPEASRFVASLRPR